MRMCRLFCLLLVFSVICCGLFSISSYAAINVLPALPAYGSNEIIVTSTPDGYIEAFSYGYSMKISGSLTFYQIKDIYFLNNGSWVPSTPPEEGYLKIESDFREEFLSYVLYSSEGLSPNKISFSVGSSDFQPFIDSFSNQISVSMVIGILVGLAGVSVTLVFMWWGVRKVSGSLMKAFKKGKIRI